MTPPTHPTALSPSGTPFLLTALATALLSCESGPSAAPQAQPRGLGITSSATPPAGTPVYARPQLRKGDRFVYRIGDLLTLGMHVTAVDAKGYQLVYDDGVVLRLDADLSEVSRAVPDRPTAGVVKAPSDGLFHWPLWPGKRWSCHYVRRQIQRPARPFTVSYECDAIETITVEAGTFECLRIWRRSRLASEDATAEDTAVFWYAPKVGYIVRRLRRGILMDLREHTRLER